MKKIAVFTEGQTEQIFSEQIIRHIAGEKQISIVVEKASGGSKNNNRIIEIKARSESKNSEYFILIVNCGNDSRVKSDILERHNNLLTQGYQKIIGIRDVYPHVKFNEIAKLRDGLSSNLPTSAQNILFVLCIMEIESWLMAEYNHFEKIHPNITVERIKKELHIDVINDDLTQRPRPSEDLSNIYWLEKEEYNKSQTIINKILNALDKIHLKNVVAHKFEDLLRFYKEIELFFSH